MKLKVAVPRQKNVARARHGYTTDRNAPSLVGKSDVEAARGRLRGSVLRFERPLDPVIDPTES